MADQKDTGGSNVPLGTEKLFKAAPTAKSGPDVLTGPHEDDRMEATSMHDPIPFGLPPDTDDDAGGKPVRQP